jgi:NAD(P)-dependent dehydrogenase (short-subunit alcohol dehydrogenase family)
MAARGDGALIITGATASLRGKPFTTAFAAGKAAQRSLAQSLARQYGKQGVHVALIIIDGMVDLPSSRERMPDTPQEAFVSPEGFADAMSFLLRQRRSAWTFELDIRPHVEGW